MPQFRLRLSSDWFPYLLLCQRLQSVLLGAQMAGENGRPLQTGRRHLWLQTSMVASLDQSAVLAYLPTSLMSIRDVCVGGWVCV